MLICSDGDMLGVSLNVCVQTTAKNNQDSVKEMFDAVDADHNGSISCVDLHLSNADETCASVQ